MPIMNSGGYSWLNCPAQWWVTCSVGDMDKSQAIHKKSDRDLPVVKLDLFAGYCKSVVD
jgi:hypothetical protein